MKRILLFYILTYSVICTGQSENDLYLDKLKYNIDFHFEEGIIDENYSNGQTYQLSFYNEHGFTDSIVKYDSLGTVVLRAKLLSFGVDSARGTATYSPHFEAIKYYCNNSMIAVQKFYTDSIQRESFCENDGSLYYEYYAIDGRIEFGSEVKYLNDSIQTNRVIIEGECVLEVMINFRSGVIIGSDWKTLQKPDDFVIEMQCFDNICYINLEELKDALNRG